MYAVVQLSSPETHGSGGVAVLGGLGSFKKCERRESKSNTCSHTLTSLLERCPERGANNPPDRHVERANTDLGSARRHAAVKAARVAKALVGWTVLGLRGFNLDAKIAENRV